MDIDARRRKERVYTREHNSLSHTQYLLARVSHMHLFFLSLAHTHTHTHIHTHTRTSAKDIHTRERKERVFTYESITLTHALSLTFSHFLALSLTHTRTHWCGKDIGPKP